MSDRGKDGEPQSAWAQGGGWGAKAGSGVLSCAGRALCIGLVRKVGTETLGIENSEFSGSET